MDEKEYLEQIARTNRPAGGPSKLKKVLSSKFFIVGAIGVGLLIIVMIIGALLSNKGDETTSLYSLKLKVDNVNSAVVNYRASLNSPDLDSNSVSLAGVLATTSRDIGVYLGEVDTEKNTNLNEVTREAAVANSAMVSELSRAKTSGTLDRVYANRISNEIVLIMNAETNIINSTGQNGLKNVLTKSYNSLNNLYKKFSEFLSRN